ncbi:MAG TPA: hypothetical protein VIJ42_10330 [Stellaceae bacterium]
MYTILPVPCVSATFNERVYADEIFRFDGMSAMRDLVAFTTGFLEDAFFPHAPPEIHRHLSHEAQVETFAERSREFGQSAEVKRLWRALFDAVGLDPMAIARDRLRLRFQPSQPRDRPVPRASSTATIAFHRDT